MEHIFCSKNPFWSHGALLEADKFHAAGATDPGRAKEMLTPGLSSLTDSARNLIFSDKKTVDERYI